MLYKTLGCLIKSLGEGPWGPHKVPGGCLKLARGDFGAISGKFTYDKDPGEPYKALGGLIRLLGSSSGPWGPYKALGVLIRPLGASWLAPLGAF